MKLVRSPIVRIFAALEEALAKKLEALPGDVTATACLFSDYTGTELYVDYGGHNDYHNHPKGRATYCNKHAVATLGSRKGDPDLPDPGPWNLYVGNQDLAVRESHFQEDIDAIAQAMVQSLLPVEPYMGP